MLPRRQVRPGRGQQQAVADRDVVTVGHHALGHVVGTEQARDCFTGGTAEHLVHRAGLQHLAVGEHQDFVGQQRGLQRIVGHQDGGSRKFPLQRQQLAAQAGTQRCVQRRERFVQQQQVGRARQRAGKRHPLLLSER